VSLCVARLGGQRVVRRTRNTSAEIVDRETEYDCRVLPIENNDQSKVACSFNCVPYGGFMAKQKRPSQLPTTECVRQGFGAACRYAALRKEATR